MGGIGLGFVFDAGGGFELMTECGGVVGFVFLLGATDGEGFVGDVLGDGGSRGHVGIFSDIDGGDEF